MKKDEISITIVAIILGLVFVIPISALACVGNLSSAPAWAIFALIVMAIFGLECSILKSISLKKLIVLKNAFKNKLDDSSILLLQDDLKEFGKLEIIIMTSQVPFFLLVAFVWAFIYAIKAKTNTFSIIMAGVAIVFLTLVIISLIQMFIKRMIFLSKMKKASTTKLQGVIEKIYIADYLKSDKDGIYSLKISYKENGKTKNFVTAPIYSKPLVSYMNKLEYVPLIKNVYGITIDRPNFSYAPKKENIKEIDFNNLESLPKNSTDKKNN